MRTKEKFWIKNIRDDRQYIEVEKRVFIAFEGFLRVSKVKLYRKHIEEVYCNDKSGEELATYHVIFAGSEHVADFMADYVTGYDEPRGGEIQDNTNE